jgi:hypothetical protein
VELTPRDSCHGEAIFPGVVDLATGKSIIAGKTITGFTTQAESDMHIMDVIRSWNEPLIDEWAEKLGAKCMSSSLLCWWSGNRGSEVKAGGHDHIH